MEESRRRNTVEGWDERWEGGREAEMEERRGRCGTREREEGEMRDE